MTPFAAFPPAAMRRDLASYYVSMRNLPEPSFYNGKVPSYGSSRKINDLARSEMENRQR